MFLNLDHWHLKKEVMVIVMSQPGAGSLQHPQPSPSEQSRTSSCSCNKEATRIKMSASFHVIDKSLGPVLERSCTVQKEEKFASGNHFFP